MRTSEKDIAVIGIGCRLPREIRSPEALWEFLCQQGDATTDVPPDRWSIKRYFDPDFETPGKTYMRRGSFLRTRIGDMEPLFFGISPKEATLMDPQQRLLLEVCWHAMEDAAIVPASLSGTNVGIYVGTFSLDWLVQSGSPMSRSLISNHYAATAASATMLSARLSHVFGFQGPSMSIDTACSSSLVAIHQACSGLNNQECDMALAGGVNLMLAPGAAITMAKGHFLSADGRCKSFSADADGYGRGEGCGMVVLKRLSDARRDGDHIQAVICGAGSNQDGRSLSLTMPTEAAQAALIKDVAARSSIDPADICYIEAHGTGTPVGDPIEVGAIGSAIGSKRPIGKPVVIGSVKANIGHLEAAAGVTGLIKSILCLRHGAVPPQANVTKPNPNIPFDKLGVSLAQHRMTPLIANGDEIYVGVNSFGYGGTNAFALLRAPLPEENPEARHALPVSRSTNHHILPLSALADESLRAMAKAYADRLGETTTAQDLADICYSAATVRTRFLTQTVLIAHDVSEMKVRLDELANGQKHDNIITGKSVTDVREGPVFVFSGMGSQWRGMGQWLLQNAPEKTLQLIKQCDEIFATLAGWSIVEEMLVAKEKSRIDDTTVAQPAIFLLQIALVDILKSRGIVPAALVGHSIGEVAAAYCAGALDLEDAVSVVFHRSQQQSRLVGRGGMLAVGISADDARARLLSDGDGKVSIAAVNSHAACTLAGDSDVLEAIAKTCNELEIFNRRLEVELPYHSPAMEDIKSDLIDALKSLNPRAAQLPLYSTVHGERVSADHRHDATYWYTNARQPVLFSDAITSLLNGGHQIFLEIGAHPVLSSSIRQCAQRIDKDIAIVPSLHRREQESSAISRIIARLSNAGMPLDWQHLTGGKKTNLPLYIWTYGFFLSETKSAENDRIDATVHPILGTPIAAALPCWTSDINPNYLPWLPDHNIDGLAVFPAAGYIEAALAAHGQLEKHSGSILENIDIVQALLLDKLEAPTVECSFAPSTRVLTIASKPDDELDRWNIHATIRILNSAPWAIPTTDISRLRARMKQIIEPSRFYATLAEFGLRYGTEFQVIRELAVSEGEAFAYLKLSEREAIASTDYFLHPALLDGAFQAFIGACYDAKSENVFVPRHISRLVYHQGRHAELYAHARLVRTTSNEIEGAIHLFDAEGQVVATVDGFIARAVPRPHAKSKHGFYHNTWVETEPLALLAEPSAVLLVGRNTILIDRMTALLSTQGISVSTHAITDSKTPSLTPISGENFKAIVYLPHDDDQGLDLTSLCDLRDLACTIDAPFDPSTAPRLMTVTYGAVVAYEDDTTVNVAQNAIRGMMRGVAAERPDLSVKIIDVDPSHIATTVRAICAELLHADGEDDVALRGSRRFVARVARCSKRPEAAATPFDLTEPNIGVRLTPSSTGSLEQLRHERFSIPPLGENDILFRTLSAALNFKDVLKAMSLLPTEVIDGTYHGDALGMEASAEVLAVGPGVTGYEVGGRYLVSWPGCFASHFVADAEKLFALPLDGLGEPIDAVTLPVAFVTAYYGLVKMAQLQPGESVLIHAGTGGVGLAAIQLAQFVGARVYATAGSEEKRAYLRELGCEGVWNSRTLEFGDGIRAATNGRGVDVVLNSLAGDAQALSLELVATFGRFVEIGKRDIIERRSLSLVPFNENLTFFSLDLDRIMAERPELMRSLLNEISSLIRGKSIRTLPNTSFRAADATEAFKLLFLSKHIGKVVIDYSDLDELRAGPLPKARPAVRDDATYLITGGFGGFGLAVAHWLARNNAKHIALLGRNGSDNEASQQAIDDLKTLGVTIDEIRADITDEKSIAAIFHDLQSKPMPLRGIFHCAAHLEDSLLNSLDKEKIDRTLLPKAKGALILDDLSRSIPIDYFVLFSSITTTLGNVGQSAYIAANAVLDGLAWKRRQEALPALSVNWGAIGDVGMLSRNNVAVKALQAAGLQMMTASEALDDLPALHDLDLPQVADVDINWTTWTRVFPGAESLERFTLVQEDTGLDGTANKTLAALTALAPDSRLPYVVEQIKIMIGKTLGIDPVDIDDQARLSELGIDSLAGVELQTALKIEFGVEISILVLAQNESIKKMSQILLKRIKFDRAPTLIERD